MTRNIITASALILAALFIGGCSLDPDSASDDNPASGSMSAATADRVFTWKPGEITKFLSAAALSDYLGLGIGKADAAGSKADAAGSKAAAAASGSLVINRIGGKAVTRIAAGAFSPKTRGGADDITTVVRAVSLPDTIESLGAGLFANTSAAVTISIPPAVAERIPQSELQSAAGSSATIQKVDPANPSSPEIIAGNGSSGGGGGGGGAVSGGTGGSSSGGSNNGNSGGSSGSSGNNHNNNNNSSSGPPAPPPDPAPVLLNGPVITYDPAAAYAASAAFTFDMAVLVSDVPGWTLSGNETATITAVPVSPVPGEPCILSLTVANSAAPAKTLAVPAATLMPVSGPFTPAPGGYTIAYADRHGAASFSSGAAEGWYYVEDLDLRRLFNALYTPNAPDSPLDSIEGGRKTVPYDGALSQAVLGLFHITLGASRSEDRVEIRGPVLPAAAAASAETQIVIDIGLSAQSGEALSVEDNRQLPPFTIPYRGLGTAGSTYSQLRFRVNWGATLVVAADNSAFASGGAGHPCPAGYAAGVTVETMPRSRYRSEAYEGSPLGERVRLIARTGSAIAVGPAETSDPWYQGWLIGLSSDYPRLLWDGGDQTGDFIEFFDRCVAFAASITVRRTVILPYRVWFVNGPTLTIDVTADSPAIDGRRGLFAQGPANAAGVSGEIAPKFYGTASTSGGIFPGKPASTIKIKAGSVIARSFLAAEALAGFIGASGGDRELLNKGGKDGATSESYQAGLTQYAGYLNWPTE